MPRASEGFRPGKLWGLWDMERIWPASYFILGEKISSALKVFSSDGSAYGSKPLTDDEQLHLRSLLTAIRVACQPLGLTTSRELLEGKLKVLPTTAPELGVVMDAIYAELRTHTFLYVPPDVAGHFENDAVLSAAAKAAFPHVHLELKEAGNCLASALPTAAVFHTMRAAEIGLWALARKLKVTFPHPVELEQWHPIIEQMESKIGALKGLKKSAAKDAKQKFYSQAASQFRYFKDGWRVRASHARETFSESQAMEIFRQTISFFELLAQAGVKERRR